MQKIGKLRSYTIEKLNRSFRDDLKSYLIDLMKENNFSLINDPASAHYKEYKNELKYLLNESEGEMLFKKNSHSNFFVFAKYDRGGVKFHYTNPDTNPKTAFSLKQREIVKIAKLFSFDDVKKAVFDVRLISGNKPETKLFVNMHSHLGYINYGLAEGKIEMKQVLDDGVSPERDLIRNLLISNYDVDASGYHNAFIKQDFEILERLEQAVGIVKIPSIELTLPVGYPKQPLGFRNGIHHLVYFADKEIASEIHEKFLLPKSRDLPGEAPDRVEYRQTLKDLKSYFNNNLVAIALPHPAGKLSSVIKGEIVSCGALNLVELGKVEIEELLKKIRQFNMPVANFNLTITDKEVKPKYVQTEKEFKTWIMKAIPEIKEESELALVEPNLNYGFANFLKYKNCNQIVFSETDKHFFHPMEYKPWVGALLRAMTILEFNDKLQDINSRLFVKGILNKSEFSMYSVLFAEHKRIDGKFYIKILEEREAQPPELEADKIASVKEGLNDLWRIITELSKAGLKKIKSFF